MPELPEVETTVKGLKDNIIGLKIIDAWSNYNSSYFRGSETIKDPIYFRYLRKKILGGKIASCERRAKNILINLNNRKTILIHMKMTGHLLYGKYEHTNKQWIPIYPEELKDPFNQHIHFVISLNNGNSLALSDVRKFAKITIFDTAYVQQTIHLIHLGPEPLNKNFNFENFMKRIHLKPNGKIKTVLTDQKIIAGIGNIYADESLWLSGVHPLSLIKNIPVNIKKKIYFSILKNLSSGINLGGDSMSDYRNIHGSKGNFQNNHQAYRRKGLKCRKKGCGGTIERIVVAGRGTHFCNRHQEYFT